MDDLIRRQAAVDLIESHLRIATEPYQLTRTDKVMNHAFEIAVSCVFNLPSVERKKGKWIWDDEGYHCSECWFHAHGNTLECMDGTYRFCPSCGAEMVGET